MRIEIRLATLAAGLLMSTSAAHAFSKVAASGAEIQLYAAYSTNPDCSSSGQPIIRITQPPHHGHLTTKAAKVFTRFTPNNPRSVCNAMGAPGMKLFYRSQRGYVGDDSVAIDVFFPHGQNTQASFDITVR